jgi:anaerobic dimethyl sulfoxide reductase subunit B (iron-sulfur subunit)
MTYAFVFDTSACTGCKACQVACKDKNQLSCGVLWRRVYEVTGGDWQQQGEAWTNTIFGSSLSLACNHCVHPKCAGVCPVDAYIVRPDGIVYINTNKCSGCGYCSWACPYDAPQDDRKAGVYSKCDLCWDYLDQGLPPVCVSACPMRCLDLVELTDEKPIQGSIALWKVPAAEHPFPLPGFSRTEPHLFIHPHPSSSRKWEKAQVTNREEVSPDTAQPATRKELPLVVFTLLTQAAAGIVGMTFVLGHLLHSLMAIRENLLLPLVVALSATLLGILFAFLHLGNPRNAWRMAGHLKKSWLSRELLLLTLFSGLSLTLVGLTIFPGIQVISWSTAAGGTALAGVVLVWFEHRVYRLHAVAGWNTYHTLEEFTASTLILGSLLTGLLIPIELLHEVLPWLALPAAVGMLLGVAFSRIYKTPENRQANEWHTTLLLAALLLLLQVTILTCLPARLGVLVVFLPALAAEIIGRIDFYARRKPSI